MNKYIVILWLCGLVVLISSCTSDFEKYNTNPYDATKEQMKYDNYAAQAALLAMQGYVIPTDVNLAQFVECLMGGSFGGYLADSNTGFYGKNYATYSPEQDWIKVAFNDIIPKIYTNLVQLNNEIKNPVWVAVADIIKVAGIHRITDIYGHIPYSKIGEGGSLEAPYDLQKDVYSKMFEELDEAINILTTKSTSDFNPNADKVFKGKVINWIKFANSLKLRLAMRVVYADYDLAKAKAEEAVKHKISTISSNEENAYNIVAKSFLRVVMYEYNGGDSRISADITSYMNGYNDPRREKYFAKTTFPNLSNGYSGLRSGINLNLKNRQWRKYSNINMSQLDGKLLWMNAAEVAFLKAEGALRGWDMEGTAEHYYNKGIELSFQQWGASGVRGYVSDAKSYPGAYVDPLGTHSSPAQSNITIKWNSADDFETNLERIITQKWIANFPLGHEAWAEFRRTGYPRLMKAPSNLSHGSVKDDMMARRMPYPRSEYKENTENLQKAVGVLGGADNMGTRVWWDCNPRIK